MSVIETRTAHVEDVPRIALIMEAVWPHAELDHHRIADVAQDTSHSTLLAVVDGKVAGFVDGFATRTADDILRWEVDLLAVHPDFQRQGLGSLLVKASSEAGRMRGARFARGLVAVDNIASQKSFAHCGYETDAIIHALLILDRPHSSNDMSDGNSRAHLIPVKTMNYAGLWIEGRRQKSDWATATHMFIGRNNDLAGAVVPECDVDLIGNAAQSGFEKVGRYQWWQRPLNETS